jgi:hypothetical protein
MRGVRLRSLYATNVGGNKVIISASQIDKSTAWLLSNGSPLVKYLTHKYILKTPPGSKVMADLWGDVQTCGDAEEIFSKLYY